MRATTASSVSRTKKILCLMTPRGLAMSASRNASTSEPWVSIWPTELGMGITVFRPENARTFRNRAAHTSRGPRSREFALAPTAAARFAVGASVLIERWAAASHSERPLVCALSLSLFALSLWKGELAKAQRLLAAIHPETRAAS
jgi:hypothetical protein